MNVQIRPARADEWQQYRRLRLEMLTDSPYAFIDDVSADTEHQWQQRTRSRCLPDTRWIVAAAGAEWLGQMMARPYADRMYLLEVYLSPTARGQGLAETLLADIERWGAQQGHEALWLDVNERQVAARRFYSRHGFVETGTTRPHQVHTQTLDIELRKPLPAQPRSR